MLSVDTAAPLLGQTFGKYVMLRRLAIGGMAEVYLANQTGAAGFNKLVVIKLVLPHYASDSKFVELFLDEGRLAARLSHPNIAQTFDLGEAEGRYFIAMEYVMGESLSAIRRRALERRDPLPLGCVTRIGTHLLEALDYAHALTDERGQEVGLVHRDVTPSNLLITYHGGVKLLDFGIARASTQRHETQVGIVRGKFGFMAPEQCGVGQVDRRVDIFASGALLYVMATGQDPYPRFNGFEEAFVTMREARFPPPSTHRPDLPKPLEAVILKAMAREPEERYQTAGAMLTDLDHAASSLGLRASARDLASFVAGLFPSRAELVPAEGVALDPKTSISILEISDNDIVGEPGDTGPLMTRSLRGEGVETTPAAISTTPAALEASVGNLADWEHHPSQTTQPEMARPAARRLRWPWIAGASAGLLLMAGVFWALEAHDPPEPRNSPVAIEPPVSKAVLPPSPPPVIRPTPPPPLPHPVAPVSIVTPRPVITVPRSEPERKRPPRETKPAGIGRLWVDSQPWANGRVDDRPVGPTPFHMDLPEGRHRIVLENAQSHFKTRSFTVDIKANEDIRSYQHLEPQ
jgi:serine/threonine protein kinase